MFEHYSEHLADKLQETHAIMQELSITQLLIASGSPILQFRDDLHYPFKANPYFLEWLPLSQPQCYLLIDLYSALPKLFIIKRDGDFWHSPPQALPEAIASQFDTLYCQDEKPIRRSLDTDSAVIDSSPASQWTQETQLNPAKLLSQIDYRRCWKSRWQIENIRRANRLAVKGHRRAEQLFREGASEYQIHMGYLEAVGCLESELPYSNIVCLNEHCAVLHHMQLNKQRLQQNRSLLIDAGASFHGHAADITRTHAAKPGTFSELLNAMDQLQQEVVDELKPGRPYGDFHINAHHKMARMLRNMDLVRATPNHIITKGMVTPFFPHGLGHLLGVQVHDRGGLLATPDGNILPSPPGHSYLRLTRVFEKNQVVTIEPGIYFIEALLEPWRASSDKHLFNWPLIDELKPYGGIRIEDNVVVGDKGIENITREAFSSYPPNSE